MIFRIYLYIKRIIYYASKWIGLFKLARHLTRRGLRIVCYHGFSLIDEDLYNPQTFLKTETFYKRLQFLSENGFQVIELDRALNLLEHGNLPPSSIVITIDDGFYSTYECAYPLLKKFSFPATIYITTYYAIKESPIFRLVIPYMFWKTKKKSFDITGLGLQRSGLIPMDKSHETNSVIKDIIRYGETQCNNEERSNIAKMVGERLDVDYQSIVKSRILSVMNVNEIRELSENGIDIQLHTHRHSLPLDKILTSREISENRSAIEPLVEKPLSHFCYPSGQWSKKHWPWLAEVGIISAVTCDLGLNYPNTPRLALKRFCDHGDLSQIEFEAEVNGYAEIMRAIFPRINRIANRFRQ